jgi:hypothetical protein
MAMFIFEPSCFALASQAATIFFAISRFIAGLVSAAIPAELLFGHGDLPAKLTAR